MDSGFFNGVWEAVRPKNPVNGQRYFRLIPESLEYTLGALSYKSAIHGSYDPSRAVCEELKTSEGRKMSFERLVRETGEKIAKISDRPDLPYMFKVVDAKEDNAWCMPGGKIAFYEGLIKSFQNETRDFGVGSFGLEEKIAAVMAHEIVHAAARHSATAFEFWLAISILLTAFYEGIAIIFRDVDGNLPDNLPWVVELVLDKVHAISMTLITTPGSRAAELEADKYGMVYLQRAGYNPEVAVWLQEYFASQEISTESKVLDYALSFFSTHPDSTDRAEANRETLKLIRDGALR